MPAGRRNLLCWLVLVLATGLTRALGEAGGGLTLALALIGLSLAKGSLVAFEFMGLRQAPRLWPALVLGWLLVLGGVLGLAYWKGMSA